MDKDPVIEELLAMADPFDLLIASCNMLGWGIAYPSAKSDDDEIEVLVIGESKKVEQVLTEGAPGEWDIMARVLNSEDVN